MSKGSIPRPYSIPKDQFDEQFDAIFGKKENKEPATSGSNLLEDEKDDRTRED
jgi:hypothetical protein